VDNFMQRDVSVVPCHYAVFTEILVVRGRPQPISGVAARKGRSAFAGWTISLLIVIKTMEMKS
jgi:hypothetical protein